MAKILSFASWNVEHFHNDPARISRIVHVLNSKSPDVFAIYEVEGKEVFSLLMDEMPSHNFFITERADKSHMEILVGVRKSLNVFVTQKDEFRSKVPTLRPGTLVTIRKNGNDYTFLFLHLKSFNDPRSWGLRDDMFSHVASLKRKLDKSVGRDSNARFLVMGDLNTMGLSAPYNNVSDINADQEVEFLDKRMKRVGMRRLPKTHELSWWNGSENYEPGSKLDHVFADHKLTFKKFNDDSEIDVIGWPSLKHKAKQRKWIDEYSDHALLYGEIHG